MKILKYILLVLIVCSIPSIVLVGYGKMAGSIMSYLSFVLLIIYYFLNKKNNLAWPFILFALSYYLISGLIYVVDEKFFLIDFIKYCVFIVCGGELTRRTSSRELLILLLLGASSILFHTILFSDDYGRYSGFYLDPNSAGFACLLGCALCFSLKSETWKLICLSFFTFCGILTFSRTFFLMWAILIITSVLHNKGNIKILSIGLGAIVLLISLNSFLQLNTERFSFVDTIFNTGKLDQSATKSSREETWGLYYDIIAKSPTIGNGYETFTSNNILEVGVHNNYLRILGEAGVIPFFIFTGIYLFMLLKSFKLFKSRPYYLLLAISMLSLHLTNHNFNTIHHVTFVSLWLYFRVSEDSNITKASDK